MNQKLISINHNARCAYRQLSSFLREQIISGEYLPGDQLPSVDDLSRQTGLHKNTVKLAFRELRDCGLVKYLPTVGCVVRDDARCRVALILPKDNSLPLEILAGLNKALGDCGRADLLLYKNAEEFTVLLRHIQTENYSGAAIYPEHSETQAVNKLRDSGFPLVQIDNFHRDSSLGAYVDSGLFEAGMLLTEHMILHRNTPVALVTSDNPGGWKFTDGYREAHRKKHETAWSCNLKKIDSQTDFGSATEDLLSSPKPPRSIIYANPRDAFAGCKILKKAGRDNIKIASFGTLPGMDLWSIPVITASRDFYKIGFDAGQMLLEMRQLPKQQRLTLRVEKHQVKIRIEKIF